MAEIRYASVRKEGRGHGGRGGGLVGLVEILMMQSRGHSAGSCDQPPHHGVPHENKPHIIHTISK